MKFDSDVVKDIFEGRIEKHRKQTEGVVITAMDVSPFFAFAVYRELCQKDGYPSSVQEIFEEVSKNERDMIFLSAFATVFLGSGGETYEDMKGNPFVLGSALNCPSDSAFSILIKSNLAAALKAVAGPLYNSFCVGLSAVFGLDILELQRSPEALNAFMRSEKEAKRYFSFLRLMADIMISEQMSKYEEEN